jgi:hypothetical protein
VSGSNNKEKYSVNELGLNTKNEKDPKNFKDEYQEYKKL